MSYGMRRPKAAPAPETLRTLDWVRDRVRMGHHKALTSYIARRTASQKAEADAAGVTADLIVRDGFLVKNGMVTVPRAAISAFRHDEGVRLSTVLAICRGAGWAYEDHLRALARAVLARRQSGPLTQEEQDVVNEIRVREVMGS